jgi:hypothetical protein
MLFIDNKYTHIYYSIIERAKSRTITGYTENHHIIPRSLGGTNNKDNLVALTGREHFIVHWLLPKMLEGDAKRSMSHGLRMMMGKNPTTQNGRYILKSRMYELVKKTANEASKGRECLPETREKIRQGNLKRAPATLELKNKLSAAQTLRQANLRAEGKTQYTAEGRASIAKHNKERVWTDEAKAKLRQHNLGKPNTVQKGIPQVQITCPHCGLTGGNSVMKRWHMDNCKTK